MTDRYKVLPHTYGSYGAGGDSYSVEFVGETLPVSKQKGEIAVFPNRPEIALDTPDGSFLVFPLDILEKVESRPFPDTERHELAADFFHAKTGTAASYFTTDLSKEEREPYYAAADAFLSAQPERPVYEERVTYIVDMKTFSGAPMLYLPRTAGDLDPWLSLVCGFRYPYEAVVSARPVIQVDPAKLDLAKLQEIAETAQDAAEMSWSSEDHDPHAGLRAMLAELGIDV